MKAKIENFSHFRNYRMKKAITKKEFNGISWDTSDLVSCKQAVEILTWKGISEEELLKLDFGNLDVLGVIDSLLAGFFLI